jgi:dienelactone hydrolase
LTWQDLRGLANLLSAPQALFEEVPEEVLVKMLTCTLVLMLGLSCANLAQDVPQPVKEGDNAGLLKRYLKATGSDKAALRKELLALSTDDLQKAIAAVSPDKVESGVQEWATKCPDGHERPYWVYVPADYDTAKHYPLLVCMHGGVGGWPMKGEEGEGSAGEFSIQYWLGSMTKEQLKEVVVLGCSAGVPETGEEAMWWQTVGQKNVLHMISETKRRVSIDDDRVIVNGVSDGGSGTFGFAYRMPDTFAGFYSMIGNPLVPMADGSPVWLENLKGSNIYAFNGGRDPLYPAKRTTPIYDQANELGASIKHKTYPELGHGVNDVIDDEVAAFFKGPMKEWKRNLLPTEIDWTCVDAARGRRAWISIDELADLGAANAAPANAEIKIPAGRPQLGVRVMQDVEQPTVEQVVAGSTAEKMGIEEGDEIKKLDTHEIKSMQDLLDALDTKAAGDDVEIVVNRDGKEQTLKGKFATVQQQQRQEKPPLTARVIAKLEKAGEVSLTVRNAKKVTIYVALSMLEGGKLKVRLNPGKNGDLAVNPVFEVKPDNAVILDQFEQTGDKTLPWVARVEIDCAGLLGVKVKPAEPDQQEDEF